MTEKEFDSRLKEIEGMAKEYSEECGPVEIFLKEDPYNGWEAVYRYNDDNFPDDGKGNEELGNKLFIAEKYCDLLRECIKELYDEYYAEEE